MEAKKSHFMSYLSVFQCGRGFYSLLKDHNITVQPEKKWEIFTKATNDKTNTNLPNAHCASIDFCTFNVISYIILYRKYTNLNSLIGK